MSHATESMISAVFSNHVYRWNGENRLQKEGAAMGLRASGSLSRITMDFWVVNFKAKLDLLGIKLKMLKKYVDDVLVIAHNLPLGTRLNGDVLTCLPEHIKEDEDNKTTPEELTMKILNQVANEELTSWASHQRSAKEKTVQSQSSTYICGWASQPVTTGLE